MFIAILQHTPAWVWALLAGLVWLGLSQTRARQATLARVTVLPLVMLGLSLAGVLAAFGAQPLPLLAWGAGIGLAQRLARPLVRMPGATWSATTRRLHVPGSWLPLVLILAIFVLKYSVGVGLALQPSLADDRLVATGCSLAYGIFSGLFLARGRALRGLATGSRPSVERDGPLRA